ncbi:MAG: BlaI/MecI/CopY family transcriptional regulator [Saprospiraceae bacterium]|nr:BlaI/MecI/CopY family transcriptional regulator [Saprospiraceae bacterium]
MLKFTTGVVKIWFYDNHRIYLSHRKVMNMRANAPSEGEMVLLNILWDHERPMSVRELHELLGDKEVGYTTTLKQMQRMQEKGLVDRSTEGRLHLYFPLIKRDIVRDNMLQQMVENVFQGSAMDLVLHAIEQGPITKEQLESLEEWINEQKKLHE